MNNPLSVHSEDYDSHILIDLDYKVEHVVKYPVNQTHK